MIKRERKKKREREKDKKERETKKSPHKQIRAIRTPHTKGRTGIFTIKDSPKKTRCGIQVKLKPLYADENK